MWTVAVVDRLVARNTALPTLLTTAQIFVEAWTTFLTTVQHRAADRKLASQGAEIKKQTI